MVIRRVYGATDLRYTGRHFQYIRVSIAEPLSRNNRGQVVLNRSTLQSLNYVSLPVNRLANSA